jgi:hypothetical protein
VNLRDLRHLKTISISLVHDLHFYFLLCFSLIVPNTSQPPLSISKMVSSASAKASADGLNSASETAKSHWGALTIVAIIVTILATAVAGLYFSGQADDLFVYFAKKYYKEEAKAEEKVLEKVGTDKAEGFLKGMYLSPRFSMNGVVHVRGR